MSLHPKTVCLLYVHMTTVPTPSLSLCTGDWCTESDTYTAVCTVESLKIGQLGATEFVQYSGVSFMEGFCRFGTKFTIKHS